MLPGSMEAYMTVIVVEMPLLAKGITCPYCGRAIDADFVYSVEGNKYRCQDCAKKLIKKIEEMRNEVCKPEVR